MARQKAHASRAGPDGAKLVWPNSTRDQTPPLAVVATRVEAAASRFCSAILQPLSLQFLGSQVHLNLLIKMIPSVPDESARIVGMVFREKQQTLLVDLSQTEPYFEVMILNSYLWKKFFLIVYNFPMFEVVCKNHVFRDSL